jgi:hypothetical protein
LIFPWQLVGRAAGFVMLLAAAVVLALQVQVEVEQGGSALSCGSAWNALSGTAGWSEWWSADLADPAQIGRAPLRTVRCPGAVNARLLGAAVLAGGAVLLVVAGEVLGRRLGGQAGPAARRTVGRLRNLGRGLTILGSLLTVGGLIGLALLVADPDSTLFLYVGRPVVVLAGLLLVLPAILLIALGRTAILLADQAEPREETHAGP